MKEIGGYFELEIPVRNKHILHSKGIFVNSGRHAFELLLREYDKEIDKILIPLYTCDVILHPIKHLGIPYQFYHINEKLEINHLPPLNKNEILIANNYFGIKDKYISFLASRYGDKLIIDNSQAWWAPEIPNIKAFYSPRKFFGIPDGGITMGIKNCHIDLPDGKSWNRVNHLIKRMDVTASAGYSDFQENSKTLSIEPITKMSPFTLRMLQSIDMDRAKKIRQENFKILHSALGKINRLCIPDITDFECAMVYPFLTSNYELKKKLIEKKVYIPSYWPNVLKTSPIDSLEYYFATNILPLPIDQRYSEDDMNFIINLINIYG